MTIVYQSVGIAILPEGSIVHRHTSVLVDLKNRANVLEFMNIIVDETPIIPYEVGILEKNKSQYILNCRDFLLGL